MFSVNTVVPPAFRQAAMSGGCASVGKPGYGCVTTGRGAVSRPVDVRRTVDAVLIIAHPASESESRTVKKCSGSTPCSSTSPPQAAPAHKIVAATMRSGMIVCSTNGCGRKPLTVTVDVPAPEISAPSLRR